MSDIPLRARSAVEIVDAAFQLYRRQALVFIMVTALAYAPWLVLQLLIVRSAGTPTAETAAIPDAGDTLRSLIVTLGSFVTFSLMSGVLTKLGAQTYLGGTPGRVEDVIREVLPRVPALIGGAILRTFIVFLGLMFFLIPGFVLFAKYAAITPVIVMEKTGVGGAFSRSSTLTNNQKAHVLGTYGLVIVLYGLLFFGVIVIAGLTPNSTVLAQVELTAFVIVFYPIVGLAEMLLYYDLRVRNEGYDVEVLTGTLGERPVAS